VLKENIPASADHCNPQIRLSITRLLNYPILFGSQAEIADDRNEATEN